MFRFLKSRWRAILITWAVTFLIGWIDVLGIHHSLEPLSDQIAQRVNGPLMPPDESSRHILVVLIDSKFMNRGQRRQWPLAVNTLLNTIVKPIMKAKPEALFLDVSLTDMPRPLSEGGAIDQNAMLTMGQGLKAAAAEAPVYLATTLPLNECGAHRQVDLDALADGGTTSSRLIEAAAVPSSNVQIVAANWGDVGNDYPFASILATSNGSCRVVQQEGTDAAGSWGWLLSPAAEIYEYLRCGADSQCPFAPLAAGVGKYHGFRLRRPDESLLRPMALKWSSRVSDAYLRAAVEDGRADQGLRQTGALPDSALQIVRAFLPFVENFAPASLFERPCPYFNTISAQDAADSAVMPDPDFENAVVGNIVMVGTSIPIARDMTLTPFDVEVPAVYLHATALHELLRNGGGAPDYPRRPEGGAEFGEIFFEGLIVALLGVFLAPFLARRADRLVDQFARRNRTFWRIMLFPLVLLFGSFLFFVLALAASLALGGLIGLFPFVHAYVYFGSPFFIALVATLVMIEDLRARIFPDEDDGGEQMLVVTEESAEIDAIEASPPERNGGTYANGPRH